VLSVFTQIYAMKIIVIERLVVRTATKQKKPLGLRRAAFAKQAGRYV
jgi:hypothetical protein